MKTLGQRGQPRLYTDNRKYIDVDYQYGSLTDKISIEAGIDNYDKILFPTQLPLDTGAFFECLINKILKVVLRMTTPSSMAASRF